MSLRSWLPELAALLSVALFASLPAGATQFRYVFPANLAITVAEERSAPDGGKIVTATLQSRLGTLKNLDIAVESSPDLTVADNHTTLAEMAETASASLRFSVTATGKAPDEMGSWIAVRVRYQPDYDKMLATVADVKAYPIDYERERLVTIATKNRTENASYTDSVRLFIEPKGE